jgi:uncharacterized membrane protein
VFSIKRYVTAGLLSAVPLWVTWLVIAFLVGLAFDVAGPVVHWLVSIVPSSASGVRDALSSAVAQYVISVVLLLVAFYCIGLFTTRIIGRQLVKVLDSFIQKIPFVGKIYWGTRQVVEAFQAKSDRSEQVVLIEYPHPGMKTVGLVTKHLRDTSTGDSILAVYVPTTPNPTSGFLEMVPADKVVPVQWSVNDAIAFIVSGGSVGPEDVAYSASVDRAPPESNRDEHG